MRLVIEAREFATLSHDTQQELLRRFAGKDWQRRAQSKSRSVPNDGLVDLTPAQVALLVEAASEDDRRLLRLFAERGGRAKSNEILASRSDCDPESISRFVSAITNRVQAILGERSNGRGVFARESDSGEEATVYRVSQSTAQSLRCLFPML